jgi:hypothetical protein
MVSRFVSKVGIFVKMESISSVKAVSAFLNFYDNDGIFDGVIAKDSNICSLL